MPGPTIPTAPSYRLVRRPAAPSTAPVLDAAQQAVVDHRGGPLLVLAGPGTGKTTTIVEAVAARITEGADPEQVLVLTFGRRAAADVRTRVAARIGRATKEPLARTFHSYAFGLLRREAALRGEPAPRLLSGPEQDLVVRELLAGDLAGGARDWPGRLHPALPTHGFAEELRDLIMRADERGLSPAELVRLGRAEGRDDWAAAARFMRQYAGVTALRDTASYDPAELIQAVLRRWRDEPALLAAERAARRHVFVDELQDTDPAQVALLRALCGGGRDLVAVGDPDQSVYGFRGAEVDGLLSFPAAFPDVEGSAAPVVALSTSRRAGAGLLRATRRFAAGFGGPARHRRLVAAEGLPEGDVTVDVLRSEAHEAQHVAAFLRRAHLLDGVPWTRMAVVVRSTVRSLPVLRRALSAVGVPVSVAGEEVPLVDQPAVRPLLRGLECALRPERLDEDAAVELLSSSLGRADVIGLRRLRQTLRRAELTAGGGRASGELLVAALQDATVLVTHEGRVVRPALRVARLLAAARAAADAPGATAEDVLWVLWSGSGLAFWWEQASARGGYAGEAADRDLDAVVALFETAARFTDRLPAAGPELFLEHLRGQEIPSDTLAPRARHGDAVQILTAHAAKGLEWDVVCVAGVQEGSWPDLRMRGSFLGSERLVDLVRDEERLPAAVASAATLSRLLAEERRLFYVAVTRARRRLLVTAVVSEREGLTPSRFLDELDPRDQVRSVTPAARPVSLAGLVAELRQALLEESDNDGSGDDGPGDDGPGDDRVAAAALLARLAAAGARGAAPSSWWGLAGQSDDRPVRDPDELVPVSPSRVDVFTRCELRWFLEQVGASGKTSTAQSVGSLVHTVAEGALDARSATEGALMARLDTLLASADLGRGWSAQKEQAKVVAMVRRLASWLAANHRAVVATELAFDTTVGRARIGGRVDRLERDGEGRAVVVDVKTGSTKVDESDVAQHGQLAAYQVAAEAGAFAEHDLHASGGAMLVQVGKAGKGEQPREQGQPPLAEHDDPGWAHELVGRVATGMAGSAFTAMLNKHCQLCPVRTSCPLQDDGRQVGW